jgi:heme-binding protein
MDWQQLNARRIWKRLSLGVLGLLAVSQLVRPARTNPPIDPQKTLAATAHPPASVVATLDRACGDCHTNHTRWPWYANVAPISWWIIDHVNEGRRRVSFSNWGDYDTPRRLKELDEICRRVERHNMPLESYLLMHHDAELSDQDPQAICDWTRTAMLPAPTGATSPPDSR